MTAHKPFSAVILAAGKGTRMRSDTHKILHALAGRPLLGWVLDSLAPLSPDHTVVVTGSGREQVENYLKQVDLPVTSVTQEEQLGTAHAVAQAKSALKDFKGDIVVLYGDVPLVQPKTIKALLERLHHEDKPTVAVLAFRPDDPRQYGRIVTDKTAHIQKMVEYKDASEEERAITLCNSGLLAIRAHDLWPLLSRVQNNNASGEYYLPDIVMLALSEGRQAVTVDAEAWEVSGVNNRAELASLESLWQNRKRQDVMKDGASLIAPETVWFSYDTEIGRDVIIEPQVYFGRNVKVANGVTIHSFSHIEGADIKENVEIGPFARLRPGAEIAEKAKIGNFVEIKKSKVEKGAKVNHLTYIGDATIGAGSNIGGGTITCNYDGFNKSRTEIGEKAFIGSNSALVAPVRIGAGAIIAAGSTITHNVPDDSLAIARSEQENKALWAKKFRQRKKKK
ncbi:bifunctional UDP-N-acetylglucosamine diphosphorylase/glucosamine-1-phosphate N-acetyltransferase GlmU [Zymomonas mobilis]|uniref:bifunctional UDP-N-acetylglucosamine diphosphorylase/glucosamine-1-phosphate N-acetyltransferase GlmU n=1 Tax=Zymomonas mobilis TaxID=542 RepID=UPI0003C75DFE|nr:bifunctional UDP-N-acetylglucosamine diphosphorylase/glucosamine-1-phosphate N-acetyltransferase GlmU [Zymomonas mobilis]AHB10089.1 UDP-N-acetylglucosamine diphosphorylase/glucosamine-1-phosphate N-acetyltransferase [Zymomonas mobilis subsp. mobilis str. CP4 = NRRL B-14023]AHJ70395.1 Bifunctional protein GlmU [Zymomonas mobilis subsp. mobilis NRRL B-12526]AHJ72250.1 Bifunctional protein GlmU [Zymomonas mobilis subsp. mobilis str. CP4 = NRRL B-14023]MCP9307176.1 bifunctional UDP-N-acetylgluco